MSSKRQEQAKIIEKLSKKKDKEHGMCHFRKNEIEKLLSMFNKYVENTTNKKKLDRLKFRDILHDMFGMTDDMLMDRNCFSVYDLNQDGYISREEIFQLLKQSLIKQPSEEDPDEGIKDLVELVLKKMDKDHDGRLSYADFEVSVKEEPLLLEAFGMCIPKPEVS
ncbi:EFCB1-like protein [Mya arenaria]|uniref:EFCB1-like protein n=1 Tax=Mya arenaria TaxID=6604 RepID=A0ABY7DBT7_MYAAR|nr:EFCB1-like protein [Mya arenaria]